MRRQLDSKNKGANLTRRARQLYRKGKSLQEITRLISPPPHVIQLDRYGQPPPDQLLVDDDVAYVGERTFIYREGRWHDATVIS